MSSTHATARPNGVLAAKLEPVSPPEPTPEERAALEAYAASNKIQSSYKRTAMKKFWRGNLILPTQEQQDAYDNLEKLLGDSE
jgi:hypothetical protein